MGRYRTTVSVAACALLVVLCSASYAAAPSIGAAAAPRANAGASSASGGKAQAFDVHEYRVLGNTVLPVRDIERVLYPRLGARKTLVDVDAARAALEKLYHDRGYQTVFVDIPPQDVSDGVVRLQVSEGRVHARSIHGARYYSEQQILSSLPSTMPGSVLALPQLQQELNSINAATSDRSVVPVLRAGPVPGTVDLALTVSDRVPLHASVEFDNQATPDTTRQRASVGLSYDDLFGDFDTLSAQYQDVPAHLGQAGVLLAAFAYHPIVDGIRPSLSVIDSTSNFATLAGAGVLGKGQVIGVQAAMPLVTSQSTVQSVTLGLDYKHFRNTITVSGSPGLATPISYVNASLAYAGNWFGHIQTESLAASINFGPRGLANNNAEAFANDRFLARANYFYLRADASETTVLPERFALKLRLAGQFANEPLISNEDLSIAGADGVRGYLEAEALADRAVKGTAQLQAPPLMRHQRQLGDLFAFFDAGRGETIDALPGQPQHVILRSWGVGVHVLPGQKVNAALTWAVPLDTSSYTRRDESRWLFDIHGSW